MMPMKPDSEDDPSYDIFKQVELSSLEVVEENAPKRPAVKPPPRSSHRWNRKRRVMVALFAGSSLIALAASGISLIRSSSKPQPVVTINTQSLDNGTLNQLTVADGGTSRQQLTISPDTLFLNSVTINKDLTVMGQTNLQSSVSIANGLAIGGDLSVNGEISAGNLNVGSVNMSSLRLSGNLEFGGHLSPTGAVPSIRSSVAAAGGSVTIDGNDTSGTITVLIGNGKIITGEMAIITFRSAFPITPKVQLTPLSASASKLDYFVTRTAGFFTIEATSLPTAGSSYIFDYFVTQ